MDQYLKNEMYSDAKKDRENNCTRFDVRMSPDKKVLTFFTRRKNSRNPVDQAVLDLFEYLGAEVKTTDRGYSYVRLPVKKK